MLACQPTNKCHMKRSLEFEKNDVGHMTFAWEANMSASTIMCVTYLKF